MSDVSIKGAPAAVFDRSFYFNAEDLDALETNFAPLVTVSGTTVKYQARSFSNSTEQYANKKLRVPQNIDPTGTITIRAYVMASTAAADKNIALTFSHVAVADDEDFDGSYADVDSGDVAISATQDDLTLVEFSVSNSTAGWVAGDEVFWRISRPAASADNLASAMYLTSIEIAIGQA